MRAEIKFCGLTRPEDAAMGASLGAGYLGVILAPSARRVSVEEGRAVLAGAGGGRAKRVGVFAGWDADAVARAAEALALDVVQLHGAGEGAMAEWVRARLPVIVSSVVHVEVGTSPAAALARLPDHSWGDATLVDARVDGLLGGTGRSFDWERARSSLAALREKSPIILAGGLDPDNVARAIAILAPDVVDVSSGVESSPGIKDHARMRAFADAVHGAPLP